MLTLFSAIYFKRKAEDTFPAVIFLFMLLLYIAGILGVISHVKLFVLLYLILGVLFFVILIVAFQKKSIWTLLSESITLIKSPGIFAFFAVSVFFILVTSHMRVTNWDDLHYWAIFPKDMAAINGVPTGDMSSTLYRDYFPIVQFLYFAVFKLTGGFSEASMFAVNYFLIYMMLFPLFIRHKGQGMVLYVCSVLSGIILPFVCSFQMLHCLGVDIIMTFLFGACIIWIYDTNVDVFYYTRIILATAVLTLSKTMGLIFSAVLIALFMVKRVLRRPVRGIIPFIMLIFSNLGFYASWRLFCRIKGNTTYLSDNLFRNLGDSGLVFPDYTEVTIKKFFYEYGTLSLNGGKFGISAVCMLVIAIVAFAIYVRDTSEKKQAVLGFAVLVFGNIGYLFLMLYTYLFVFDQWEAETLSSFDRYIATYSGAILYVAFFVLTRAAVAGHLIYGMAPLLLFLTVNYPYIGETLVPSGFERAFGNVLARRAEIDKELHSAFSPEMNYGDHVIIVDIQDTEERSKTIPYCSVPYVVRSVWPEEGEELQLSKILYEAEDFNAKWVIFLEPGDNGFTNELSEYERDRLYAIDELTGI